MECVDHRCDISAEIQHDQVNGGEPLSVDTGRETVQSPSVRSTAQGRQTLSDRRAVEASRLISRTSSVPARPATGVTPIVICAMRARVSRDESGNVAVSCTQPGPTGSTRVPGPLKRTTCCEPSVAVSTTVGWAARSVGDRESVTTTVAAAVDAGDGAGGRYGRSGGFSGPGQRHGVGKGEGRHGASCCGGRPPVGRAGP